MDSGNGSFCDTVSPGKLSLHRLSEILNTELYCSSLNETECQTGRQRDAYPVVC